VKIIAIVDRHGLPLAVTTHAVNHHELTLVQLTFDFCTIEAKPDNLIGDREYDSDKLDAQLRTEGVEMISPHGSNRIRKKTQDGRRLGRYERRWIVERFFAWMRWQRRLLVRWGTTRPVSSASCISQPFAYCSSNFAMGSRNPIMNDLGRLQQQKGARRCSAPACALRIK